MNGKKIHFNINPKLLFLNFNPTQSQSFYLKSNALYTTISSFFNNDNLFLTAI